MATTVIVGSVERKLSVSETLEHATEALAAHRAWMKRRVVRNSVSPATHPKEESLSPKQVPRVIADAPSQPRDCKQTCGCVVLMFESSPTPFCVQ